MFGIETALLVQVVVGAFFLAGTCLGHYGLVSTIACFFLLLSCAGITYPNAAAIALAPFSQNAGRASALLGFMQLGLGSILSSLVGVLAIKGSAPTAIVMAFSALFGYAVLYAGKSARQT